MPNVKQLSTAELDAGLGEIRQSPEDEGPLELIVARPQKEERDVLEEAKLDVVQGLLGDNWKERGSGTTSDGSANPGAQLTIMNARAIALIAHTRDRWQLAGDQLFLDLNISPANLPPGAQLSIGSAIVEVTDVPHPGCKKFVERFGLDAMNWVNSPDGKALNLRGINTKVVQSGSIRVGDVAKKL